MTIHNGRTLGVCSWSLQPSSPGDLASKVSACGLSAVQLALDPIREGSWGLGETSRALADAGITIASGMMVTAGEDYSTLESIKQTGGLRPDTHWEANLASAKENAQIADELEISLVTLHAGFLPHEPGDPERETMIDRLVRVAGAFGHRGVALALETGQETAQTLADLLADPRLAGVGVNFDPANMILYAMGDPTEAMRLLRPHVHQVHMKDATATRTPGEWGAEVPAGTGEVDWKTFFGIVRTLPGSVSVMIEREAGDERDADISTARELAEQLGL
ncbi:MAG: L-ribulose-5-phosphate 3-epimerase [Phycisphaerales bacterium]|jgi:L-ribulose-5-phosphate 3-epimerase